MFQSVIQKSPIVFFLHSCLKLELKVSRVSLKWMRVPFIVQWGQTAVSPHELICPSCSGCSRAASGTSKDKEPPKKAKTPQGRFDSPEDTRKDVLESEDAYASFSLVWVSFFIVCTSCASFYLWIKSYYHDADSVISVLMLTSISYRGKGQLIFNLI